jgi:predicted AlkP superfamily pyrophosphatase or phosphodiesterase
MHRTLVILAVGLTPDLIGAHTPHLAKLAARGGLRPLDTITPAVTSSVQSTLVTGLMPSGHGVVANGWYFRDSREVLLWRQANDLVGGEKIWDAAKARNPDFSCAKMFWWFNMYSSADFSATPRPMYPADGRKIPDHYTYPSELHDELDARFGPFPLFKFWGPLADIESSSWIAGATRYVMETRNPTLTLTYLPHLDYNLQRIGPDLRHPRLQADLREIDELCGMLIETAEATGQRVIVVSEYGITPATQAIHINRTLREAGFVAVRREEGGREILDAGASAAFAMADHQIAHVYVADPAHIPEVKGLVEALDGVESVWDEEGKRARGLDHPRSGELVAIARADHWFSYYYWLNEAVAPDFARTVDIHRKPGFDPVELFIDPEIRFPKLAAAWKLAKRRVGQRQLLDIISSSAAHLVRGTHGRITDDPKAGPLVISSEPHLMPDGSVAAVDFKRLVLDHVFDPSGA